MSQAFDAIHDEALKPVRYDDLPGAAQDELHLIISLSRHKRDVRGDKEKQTEGGR